MTKKPPKLVNLAVGIFQLQVTSPQMKPKAVKIEKVIEIQKAFLKIFKEPGKTKN